ncbi:hypothetical protein KIPB_005294 [Kipferlia bialata]|uniref:Uncharacterized protein n=1 Tax=Kipferlia bialata TaxID=797122 RepID=A0A9K3GI11_9EUKA|nr:hypothetical protein KIPB_005294 [Kipferlia bialata]|eukprot:g5294.t1
MADDAFLGSFEDAAGVNQMPESVPEVEVEAEEAQGQEELHVGTCQLTSASVVLDVGTSNENMEKVESNCYVQQTKQRMDRVKTRFRREGMSQEAHSTFYSDYNRAVVITDAGVRDIFSDIPDVELNLRGFDRLSPQRGDECSTETSIGDTAYTTSDRRRETIDRRRERERESDTLTGSRLSPVDVVPGSYTDTLGDDEGERERDYLGSMVEEREHTQGYRRHTMSSGMNPSDDAAEKRIQEEYLGYHLD